MTGLQMKMWLALNCPVIHVESKIRTLEQSKIRQHPCICFSGEGPSASSMKSQERESKNFTRHSVSRRFQGECMILIFLIHNLSCILCIWISTFQCKHLYKLKMQSWKKSLQFLPCHFGSNGRLCFAVMVIAAWFWFCSQVTF